MRQVYFDPFGKYVEGYDAGAGRQLQTEKDIRDARAADYEYRVNAPLRSQVLGSEARVGTAIEPYRVSVAQARANLEQQAAAKGGMDLGGELSMATGSAVPAVSNIAAAIGATPRFNPDGSVSYIGAHGNEILRGDPNEMAAHVNASRQGALELQRATIGELQGRGNYYNTLPSSREYGADARLYGTMYTADGRLITAGMRNSPAIGGFDPFAGQNNGTDFTNPGGFGAPATQPAQPAQPQPQTAPATQQPWNAQWPQVSPSQPQAQQTQDDSYNLGNSYSYRKTPRPRPNSITSGDTDNPYA